MHRIKHRTHRRKEAALPRPHENAHSADNGEPTVAGHSPRAFVVEHDEPSVHGLCQADNRSFVGAKPGECL